VELGEGPDGREFRTSFIVETLDHFGRDTVGIEAYRWMSMSERSARR
jgi:hypothetical protein